jgi:hypothetical protein
MTETQFLDYDVRTSFEESYINFVLQGVKKTWMYEGWHETEEEKIHNSSLKI